MPSLAISSPVVSGNFPRLASLVWRATLASMTRNLLQLATNYHKALLGRIRRYLNQRGISDIQIDFHLLGWNGNRITIPIFNRDGELAFFKRARDPESPASASKMLTSPGAYAELYGWEVLLSKPSQVIICEGEFDRLVLEAKGFLAVTSTGGAGTFRKEWAEAFSAIPEVFGCYDNDEAGRFGADRVGRLLPHAKIVELPDEVGPGGDVTDFFVRLGKSRGDFQKLLDGVLPAPPSPPMEAPSFQPRTYGPDSPLRQRVDQLKREVPIAEVVTQYLKLQTSGKNLTGLCPFHEDHNPSLTVFPATGTFHCFSCRKHGDVITFLREMEHLGFTQALDALDQLKIQYGAKAE